MNKAIFYKERIKIRRFYPLATAVLAGFTAYALLRIGRMYAFNGAASVWLAVLDRGDVLVDPLKYLPALVGAGLGLAQFLPEITQKRLKLTLHLPDSRRAMMLGMLGYGLVLLTVLFAVQLLAIGLYLRHLMAPELVHAVVSTTLPWYAAGFAGYLFAAWICIEPTWRQRLFDALIELMRRMPLDKLTVNERCAARLRHPAAVDRRRRALRALLSAPLDAPLPAGMSGLKPVPKHEND